MKLVCIILTELYFLQPAPTVLQPNGVKMMGLRRLLNCDTVSYKKEVRIGVDSANLCPTGDMPSGTWSNPLPSSRVCAGWEAINDVHIDSCNKNSVRRIFGIPKHIIQQFFISIHVLGSHLPVFWFKDNGMIIYRTYSTQNYQENNLLEKRNDEWPLEGQMKCKKMQIQCLT